jgi:hypothetical protein
MTVWLERDDPDSRVEVAASLARLIAAGHVEEVSEGQYCVFRADPSTCSDVTRALVPKPPEH